MIYTNEKSFADFEDMELIFPAVKSRAENMDKANRRREIRSAWAKEKRIYLN